jgi:hypothetical protein
VKTMGWLLARQPLRKPFAGLWCLAILLTANVAAGAETPSLKDIFKLRPGKLLDMIV